MSGDPTPYLNLVTSEHRNRPNFIALLTAYIEAFVDNIATAKTMPGLFDVDVAVGDQLDKVGQWVGVSRNLSVPLTSVYFAFDTVGLGFDQGTWFGPYNPITQIVSLPDDAYRTLLKARIAANQWDGTIPGAEAIYAALFGEEGFSVFIQDNQDMTMLFGLLGPVPDAITIALLTGGYLDLKPGGVGIEGYVIPTVPMTPLFGFDVDNDTIAGFDMGAWGRLLPGS